MSLPQILYLVALLEGDGVAQQYDGRLVIALDLIHNHFNRFILFWARGAHHNVDASEKGEERQCPHHLSGSRG